MSFRVLRGFRPVFFLLGLCAVLQAAVSITGKVLDETGAAVAGARVELRPVGPGVLAVASSDRAGSFLVTLTEPGDYTVFALRQGFFALTGKPEHYTEGSHTLTITLNHVKELTESIDVTYSPPAIDLQEPTERKELDNVEIQAVPYPAPQDFRNALPLLNGVVQDTAGRVHFNGGAVEQTNVSLDGFHVSDPVTGRLEARLNIDSVRSLDVEGSRVSAEQGRGSAGWVDVKPKTGDDRLRFGGTNFIPSLSTEQGLHVNKWTPRLELSGPIVKNRAWFYNGFDTFYDLDTVQGLPRGENRTRGLTLSDITRLQVNLTPANILSGTFLLNHADLTRNGLTFLNPVETTTNRLSDLYFTTIRDQHYFGRGALMEVGFADTRGILTEHPQGNDVYQITPSGSRGNYFVNQNRHYYRQQWLANGLLPTLKASGSHQIKVGVDFERSSFHEEVLRHEYEVLRNDNSVARQVTFTGSPFVGRTNFEAAQYVQDHWTPREGIVVEGGLRLEWNEIVRRLLWAPRISAVWAPGSLRDTKFSAGFGVFHDSITLGTVSRHQGQASLSTFFPLSGGPGTGPVRTEFAVNEQNLRVPRYRNFSLTVERKLPLDFYGKATYLRRMGSLGFTFLPPPDPEGLFARAAVYVLSNSRSDRYNALELSVRRVFARQFEWFAGYTRSSSRTSAAVDYSLENPIFAPQMPGPFPWDAPNRFLTWGWVPVPKRLLPSWLQFAIHETDAAFLVEYHTGFPFSAITEEGILAGAVNSHRYPNYFNINLHFERKFRALHYLWAWRFGFNNITNNGNPNTVNNNIDSPGYLTYGRGQSRAFSVRLRFLGRR